MLTAEDSNLAMNAIVHQATQLAHAIAEHATAPSVLYRPELTLDGNKWCALYGPNLQEGVAGFGDSPDEAMCAFNRAWITRVPTTQTEGGV
jgi:hypothetical protein